jgi:hypothetical protein
MSTHVTPRSAGIGLLIYAIGTFASFMFAGAPGGDYADGRISSYIDPAHAPVAFTLWYVSALAALALVLLGAGIRRLPNIGGPLAALTSIGAALSVTGAWIAGGVEVGMVEGGSAVQAGVPHPVVYLLTEIGSAMAVCGPALCIGVVAIVLTFRGGLPVWLRIFCLIGGVCGILAPFFFTYFIYLLWALTMSVALIVTGGAARTMSVGPAEPADSIV